MRPPPLPFAPARIAQLVVDAAAPLGTLDTYAAPPNTFEPQADPLALLACGFVAAGFLALQLKMRAAEAARIRRDDAIDSARQTELDLLAGTAQPEQLERARALQAEATDDYERARAVGFGASLRTPDPRRVDAPRAEPVAPKLRNAAVIATTFLQVALLVVLAQDPMKPPSPAMQAALTEMTNAVDSLQE